MRRHKNLFERICSFEALVKAALEASLGKRSKPRVALFLRNLENEAIELEQELSDKTYRPRPYRTFMVRDPKTRMICASDFRDRVVHHAACKVLEPIFEKSYIHDTYACRRNRGLHAALDRARKFCRRSGYHLKLDVCKFFDSMDHGILKAMIRRSIRDPDFLWLMDVLIDHPVPWAESEKGLPIGNLTSQHFANHYLSGLDHFVKEVLRIEGYLRYMDDLVLFADEKGTLWDALQLIEEYLQVRLRLRIKEGSVLLAPVTQGLPFLGFRVFPGIVRLSRPTWRRFRRKMIRNVHLLEKGRIEEDRWIRSTAALVGHIGHADTRNLRACFFRARGERGTDRVVRGGSWNNSAHNCRSAIRNRNHPDDRNDNLGFRLSSSRPRPEAVRPRIHRLRHSPDPSPGPVPADAGRTCTPRRR